MIEPFDKEFTIEAGNYYLRRNPKGSAYIIDISVFKVNHAFSRGQKERYEFIGDIMVHDSMSVTLGQGLPEFDLPFVSVNEYEAENRRGNKPELMAALPEIKNILTQYRSGMNAKPELYDMYGPKRL